MIPQTFIFMGRSGCGKGTQAKLLVEWLKTNDTEHRDIFYLESGARFREFISQSNYTARLSKKTMESGKLQPAFLAIHVWSHLMIEQMDESKHVFIDGTPRKLEEAKILENALLFYNRAKPIIVYINVSRTWSMDRLAGRGRADDSREGVEERLNWFDTDVMPAVEYYRTNPHFNFIELNGEQSIEAIHQDFVAKIATLI